MPSLGQFKNICTSTLPDSDRVLTVIIFPVISIVRTPRLFFRPAAVLKVVSLSCRVVSCRCNRTNHVIQSRHTHRPRASTETRVSRKVDEMPLQLCQNNELLQIIGGFEVRYACNHPTTLLLITAGSHYKAIQDGMQHQARGIIDKVRQVIQQHNMDAKHKHHAWQEQKAVRGLMKSTDTL